MAYAYYQSIAPGQWGTPGFQITRPPTPGFRPQPHWSGLDFYRAHGNVDDPVFYQSVMGRMAVAIGASTHEARRWHRQVYGGQVNVAELLPRDIGSAAAYEAYRMWKYHHPLYEPLGGSPEREREAMMGMAIAEASHLWQYTGRSFDNVGRREACETAAATASHIATKVLGADRMNYQAGVGSGVEPGYGYGDGYLAAPRPLARSASWANLPTAGGTSYLSGSSAYLTPSPYARASPLPPGTPLPGTASPYGNPGISGFGANTLGAYGAMTPGTPYGTGGVSGAYFGGAVNSGRLSPYPAVSVGGLGNSYVVTPPVYSTSSGYVPQAGTAYGGGVYGSGYNTAASYGAYPGQPGTVAPGSTIIIRQPRHHHHHHRSHSMDRY